MSFEILLPRLGFSMTEGTIAEWLVADGALIEEGKPLYVLESDKSAQEIEAPASGKVRILVDSGATYPVGTVLGTID